MFLSIPHLHELYVQGTLISDTGLKSLLRKQKGLSLYAGENRPARPADDVGATPVWQPPAPPENQWEAVFRYQALDHNNRDSPPTEEELLQFIRSHTVEP